MFDIENIKFIIENNLLHLMEICANSHNNTRLVESMSYSLISGGKRIRGVLAIACSNVFDVSIERSLFVASAIELIHTYSLIHDDLPAMDNSDFRRNKPSNHIKFNEATAILSGDAFLTLAFELLSDENFDVDCKKKCKLINMLSSAIGYSGMVGGQMLDIDYKDKVISDDSFYRELQFLKTGRLFVFACESAGVLGDADDESMFYLRKYGESIGIVFQIIDDIFDNDNNCKAIVDKQKDVQLLLNSALIAIEKLGDKTSVLIQIVDLMKSLLLSALSVVNK